MCNNVLLPAPDAPTIAMNSPRRISRLIPLRTISSFPAMGNDLYRSTTLIMELTIEALSHEKQNDASDGAMKQCKIDSILRTSFVPKGGGRVKLGRLQRRIEGGGKTDENRRTCDEEDIGSQDV